MTPATPSAPQESGQEALRAEVFIDTYKIIADWIRFADAKAAATLTVNGVMMGLLVPTLKTFLSDKTTVHPTTWWDTLVVVLFLIWLALLVLSAISSFLCILPIRGEGRKLVLDHTTHFHPAAISQKYALADLMRFLGDCDALGMAGVKREVMTGILLDSHLSSSKYGYVTRSIWCLAYSVVFGFLYLLAIQF